MNPRLLRPLASGFNPRQIAGLELWLDAQDGTTLFDSDTGGSQVAPDGSVGRWVDKSGKGRNATQDVANNRPVLKTAVVNGRNILRFDGSNDFLKGDVSSSDLSFPYTLFAVYQSADAAGSIAGFNLNATSFITENVRKSAANTLQGIQQNATSTAEATVTAADASWHVAELVFTGTSSSLTYTVRVNGGATGNMATPRQRNTGPNSRRLQIGNSVSSVDGNLDPLAGDIAEIIGYGRTLSAGELSRVRQYLGRRYGITVTA